MIYIQRRTILFLIILLFTVLFFSRLKWMDMMYTSSKADIVNGVLDLQDWQLNKDEYFFLDGEWEFYPQQFLYGEKAEKPKERVFDKVPSGWNDRLAAEETPFGYGTYRLMIQLDREIKENFAVYISSIRSASEVYINGRLMEESGKVAPTKADYVAYNVPYTVIFSPDENGQIELVIQAANFKDLRDSGIVRSIKFGEESVISGQRNLSIIMQSVTVIVFLMIGLYLLLFYLFGRRDKKNLFLALLFIAINIMINISSNEKVLQVFLQVNYDQSFRVVYVLLPITLFFLLKTFNHDHLPIWSKIYRFFNFGLLLLAITFLVLPVSLILKIAPISFLFTAIAVIIAFIVLIQNLYRDFRRGLPLLLAFLVLLHDTIWTIYWREIGLSVIYYPFDILIAAFIFSTILLLEYLKKHRETEQLAYDLKVISEGKTQFLANTSHEFKNPLNAILNMAHAVMEREKPILQEKSMNELNIIKKVGRRMAVLLDDLIDEASIEKGKTKLKQSSIELAPNICDVLDLLGPAIEEKQLKINVEIPEAFPLLYADENRVIQILFNLLHNAVKYTNHGNITIRATTKKSSAYISIIDSGIGMDETEIGNVFSTYERLTSEVNGYGLGLNVTKELVELHGGEIFVTSKLGVGSTFTFSLPLSKATSERLEKKDDASIWKKNSRIMNVNESVEQVIQKRPRLLVVDDDPVNLQVLQTILDEEKYDVSLALSGKIALEKVKEESWNLVISDVRMQHMSGYELTREIRALYSKTELPIILVTANSQPQDIEGGFLAGANDYVTKPIEPIELKSRVDALVDMKEMVHKQLQLESAWLQAQIYPHFIFNTLNAISALNELDPAKVESLLNELSTFLRSKYQYYSIDELIPLNDELNIVKSYLNIEKYRFGERLAVNWQIHVVDENKIKIPFLSIQPLVENAVHHGIMKQVEGGVVTIEIKELANQVNISVIDTGVGIPQEKLASILDKNDEFQTGIGLKNTHQRIRRLFGTGITIRSELHKGTKITFTIDKNNMDN